MERHNIAAFFAATETMEAAKVEVNAQTGLGVFVEATMYADPASNSG